MCSNRSSVWTIALGTAVAVGVLLGVAIAGFSYGVTDATDLAGVESERGLPPVIASGHLLGMLFAVEAGIIVGVVGAIVARSHLLLLTLAASFVAAASCCTTIVLWQWHRVRWAVGTIDGRMFAVAAVLFILICSAAMLAALAASFRRRSPNRADGCAKTQI
jgi:hypothetical protein